MKRPFPILPVFALFITVAATAAAGRAVSPQLLRDPDGHLLSLAPPAHP